MAGAVAIPALVAGIALLGWLRGVNVYDAFIRGAKRGIETAARIAPFLCAALLLIALMRSSGLLSLLGFLLKEPMEALGLPEGTLSLMIIRPVSGSASLAVLEDIFSTYGADSLTGQVAAAMMGSTETVLYVVAVYLGAAGIKKGGGVVAVSLLASVVGAVAAGIAVRALLW